MDKCVFGATLCKSAPFHAKIGPDFNNKEYLNEGIQNTKKFNKRLFDILKDTEKKHKASVKDKLINKYLNDELTKNKKQFK